MPLLVQAKMVRKINVDADHPMFDLRLTWKGCQFIELYRYWASATGKEQKDLWYRLLSFY